MTRTARRISWQALTLLVSVSYSATAQPTPSAVPIKRAARPTATVLRSVEAMLARHDSLGALAELDSALAYDRRNGPLWNTYGQIAWEMSKREKGPFMRPSMIRLRMRADSAFRYATAFAPDSAEYFLDLGRYALETNLVWIRQGAKGTFNDGIKLAVAQGRGDLSSPMIDQLGMFHWRDYEGNNRRGVLKSRELVGPTAVPQGAAAMRGGSSAAVYRDDYGEYVRDRVSLVTPVTGEAEFVQARRNFEDALVADPSNASARRHIYMALADHEAWPDLLKAADRTLRATEEDIDAWLARGIAAAAQEDYDNAAKAFDNALRRMSNGERARFTSFKRLLSPSNNGERRRFADSLHWDSLAVEEQRRQEALFWSLADPRTNTRVNEALIEFHARVAYADLRFGSEEYRIRGADSDRGRVWIRYGPPAAIYSTPGVPISIVWIYDRPQATFVFRMMPTFGTAYHPFGDVSTDSIMTEHPVGWDNLPLVRRTWPMRMRAVRFRSSADSMDVVVTAAVPVRSFLSGVELVGAMPINVQLDVHDPAARIVGRELRKVTVSMDSLPAAINGAWVRRLGRGANVIRVDAEQPDVNRGASNAVDAAIDTTSGFGISDLLLGTNPRTASNTDPKRWHDVSVAPTTGVFPWSQSLGVVWEMYDLASSENSVKYRVNVLLERTFKNSVAGFLAKISAYTKNVIQRNGAGTGMVAVTYDQARPSAAVITDFVSVNLDGSVPGTYKLTIEIEDLVSKRVTKRTTDFVLTRN